MAEAQQVMEQAERDGTNPEEALRGIVQKAVEQGLTFGSEVGEGTTAAQPGDGAKRARGE